MSFFVAVLYFSIAAVTEIMMTLESWELNSFIAIDDGIPLLASTIPYQAIPHTHNWSQINLNK